jgi:hypothetical protein
LERGCTSSGRKPYCECTFGERSNFRGQAKQAKCPEERAKGETASQALADLLARGAVTVHMGDPKSRRLIDR